MTTATGALAGDEVIVADADDALAEFQWRLSMMFSRARALWKEPAGCRSGCTRAGYKLLGFVARSGTSNAHQLAEAFEMDKSVVSRQVRALEDLGLVVSRPDELDGRQRVLAATSAAHEALQALRVDHAERMRAVLADLTPDELAAASKAVRCLSDL